MSDNNLTANQARVLGLLAHYEVPTVGELAYYGHLKPSSVRTALMALMRRGYVDQVGSAQGGGACYRITGAGKEQP